MFGRFFTGEFNAATSLLFAVIVDVLAILFIAMIGLIIFIPGYIALGAVVWALVAAARNHRHSGFTRFLCGFYALLQVGFILALFGVFRG